MSLVKFSFCSKLHFFWAGIIALNLTDYFLERSNQNLLGHIPFHHLFVHFFQDFIGISFNEPLFFQKFNSPADTTQTIGKGNRAVLGKVVAYIIQQFPSKFFVPSVMGLS